MAMESNYFTSPATAAAASPRRAIQMSRWPFRIRGPHRFPEEILMLASAVYRLLLAAGLAGLAAAAAPAHAQTPLKMNISLAQNSSYGVAVDAFAREVEQRTAGRYRIQNFYSAALGAERESVEGVQLGTLD